MKEAIEKVLSDLKDILRYEYFLDSEIEEIEKSLTTLASTIRNETIEEDALFMEDFEDYTAAQRLRSRKDKT